MAPSTLLNVLSNKVSMMWWEDNNKSTQMTFIKSNAVLAVTQEDKTLQTISSETYFYTKH